MVGYPSDVSGTTIFVETCSIVNEVPMMVIAEIDNVTKCHTAWFIVIISNSNGDAKT